MATELKALVDGLELLDGDEVAVVARRVVEDGIDAERSAKYSGDERFSEACEGCLLVAARAVQHPREGGFDPRHPCRLKVGPAEALVLQGPVGDGVVEGLVKIHALLVPFSVERLHAHQLNPAGAQVLLAAEG